MPSLVTKLIVGFTTAGILLIFALAYNLGGTKQASRNEEILSQSKERLTTLQNQLLSCRDRNSKILKGEQSDEAEVLHQEQQIDRANQVKSSLRKEYSNLRKDLQDCEAKKKMDRAEATGTTDLVPKETYHKLVAQTAVLRTSLEDVAKRRNATRQELIKLIRTYRMNNMEMINEAKQKGINLKASGKVTDNFKSSKLDRGGRVVSSGEDEVFIPNRGGDGSDPRAQSKWKNLKKFAANAILEKQKVEKQKVMTRPPSPTASSEQSTSTISAATPLPTVAVSPAAPPTTTAAPLTEKPSAAAPSTAVPTTTAAPTTAAPTEEPTTSVAVTAGTTPVPEVEAATPEPAASTPEPTPEPAATEAIAKATSAAGQAVATDPPAAPAVEGTTTTPSPPPPADGN